MATEDILGVDLHDAVIGLKRAIENDRLRIKSPLTIRALEKITFGADGRVDPSTVSPEVRATICAYIGAHPDDWNLAKVRLRNDGTVVPSSVDNSVRAMATAVAESKAEKVARDALANKVSLRDVQSQYFDILEENFGTIFSEMKRRRLNPQTVATIFSAREKLFNAFVGDLEEFATGIQEFWEHYGPVVQTHLGNLRALKAVFGGDVFPSHTTNIASSVGLYTDTIVLPCPLQVLLTYRRIIASSELFRLTVKHALNVLSYRELALADLEVPIVVISPDYMTNDSYRQALQVAGEADSLEHYSRMFGRQFSAISELDSFLKQFSESQQMVSHLVDPTRMLIDTEWSGPLEEQFARYIKESRVQAPSQSHSLFASMKTLVFGRMLNANDTIFRSTMFGGTPLVDAPTSWQYLLWKYEYDGGTPSVPSDDQHDLFITKAMELEGHESGMLSGVPAESLIELRRNGALTELREVIRKGIAEIDSAQDASLSEIGAAVIENIDNAFAEHDRQLKSLTSSRRKFYGLDVGRWLTVGGLVIAAPMVHSVALDVIAGASTMSGPPSPKELWKRFHELKARSDSLRRSPAGILFRHLKTKFGFS